MMDNNGATRDQSQRSSSYSLAQAHQNCHSHEVVSWRKAAGVPGQLSEQRISSNLCESALTQRCHHRKLQETFQQDDCNDHQHQYGALKLQLDSTAFSQGYSNCSLSSASVVRKRRVLAEKTSQIVVGPFTQYSDKMDISTPIGLNITPLSVDSDCTKVEGKVHFCLKRKIPSACEQGTSTVSEKPRKRVCFEPDPALGDDHVRRHVYMVEGLSNRRDMSQQEKCELWIQRSEIAANLKNVYTQPDETQPFGHPDFPHYVETLMEAYISCCLHATTPGLTTTFARPSEASVHHWINTRRFLPSSTLSPSWEQSAVLGEGTVRGLEMHALPNLGRERLRRRTESIQLILQYDQILKEQIGLPRSHSQDIIAGLASQLSLPSCRFAKWMGDCDAKQALWAPSCTANAVLTGPINGNEPTD